MLLKHGDKVRYIGPTDASFHVVHNETYQVFGSYPKTPMKGDTRPREEVTIYVDDPDDRFGGVVGLEPSLFEKVA